RQPRLDLERSGRRRQREPASGFAQAAQGYSVSTRSVLSPPSPLRGGTEGGGVGASSCIGFGVITTPPPLTPPLQEEGNRTVPSAPPNPPQPSVNLTHCPLRPR